MAISVAQVSLLFGIVWAWCGPPGPAALQWLALAALATAGTAVGLLISTVARSEEVATALVPIAVIPQIILASVIVPLSGLARTLAEVGISVYWGHKVLERLLPEADLARIGRQTEAWSGPLWLVVAHAAAFCAAALFVLEKRRARS
jgi:ABC-type multidrug transport system permease subunit